MTSAGSFASSSSARRRRGVVEGVVRNGDHLTGEPGRAHRLHVPLVGDHEPWLDLVHAPAEVVRAELEGAGEGHRPDAKAGEHRVDPLRAVSDERHDHVAAADPAPGAGRPRPARSGRRPPRTCDSRRSPASEIQTSASRPGSAASTTSRAKFIAADRREAVGAAGKLTAESTRQGAHGSRHPAAQREDRRAARHHRDGAPVRGRAGAADRRGARPRGQVPGRRSSSR